MRDSKVLFIDNADPATASNEVDLNNGEPGVGCKPKISVTIDPTAAAAVAGDVTLTVSGADTAGGTYADAAVITIPQAIAANGGCIYSDWLPENVGQFAKVALTGLTGGKVTAGIDWGLRSGTPALRPYLY